MNLTQKEQLRIKSMMNAIGARDPFAQTAVNGAYGDISQGTSQQTPPKAPIYNTILWRNEPVPEGWRGAEMHACEPEFCEAPSHFYWKIRIESAHSNDVLSLNIDAVEHSRKEAEAIAATMVAALNQRRLG